MAELLFDNQATWGAQADPQTAFESYATSLGLNLTQFRNDMQDPALQNRIDRDEDSAIALGANATPAFYLQGTSIATPSTLSEYETVIQAAVDAVTDILSLNRSTGALTVRDPSGLSAAAAPFEFTVNVTNAAGQLEAVPVRVTVTSSLSSSAATASGVLASTPNDNHADQDAQRIDQAMSELDDWL